MRLLFWNTEKNTNINSYVISLVKEYRIDVLILAEYNSDENYLNEKLHKSSQKLHSCNTIGCNRIKIWSNYLDTKPGIQTRYYSIQIINNEYIICSAHLFSDIQGDCSEERLEIAADILNEIKQIEIKIQSNKSLIIGDLNENPYGKACLNANGFHGLPILSENEQPYRTVKGNKYRKFYNPMWNLLGDFEYPPGTYYLNQAKLNNPMWYTLDQVLLSQSLLSHFKKSELKIITKCSLGNLFDKAGHPNKTISDHFPIVCEISI